MSIKSTHISWREDLKLARNVADAHRQGFEMLLSAARDDDKLLLATDAALATPRGQALRTLLSMFEAAEAVRLFRAA